MFRETSSDTSDRVRVVSRTLRTPRSLTVYSPESGFLTRTSPPGPSSAGDLPGGFPTPETPQALNGPFSLLLLGPHSSTTPRSRRSESPGGVLGWRPRTVRVRDFPVGFDVSIWTFNLSNLCRPSGLSRTPFQGLVTNVKITVTDRFLVALLHGAATRVGSRIDISNPKCIPWRGNRDVYVNYLN